MRRRPPSRHPRLFGRPARRSSHRKPGSIQQPSLALKRPGREAGYPGMTWRVIWQPGNLESTRRAKRLFLRRVSMTANTVCIAGVGYAVPANIRPNSEILKAFPHRTEEEMVRLTGIRERRYAGEDESATLL